MADWSSLTRDQLEKIGEKLLVSPRDYERSRAVCVHWRSSIPKKQWPSWPFNESLPSLIFPPDHYIKKQQHCHLRWFLSLFGIGAAGKEHNRGCRLLSLLDIIAAGKELNHSRPLELPEGKVLDNKGEDVAKDNLIFKGCSHGWIIAVGMSPQIYLINLSLPFKERLLRLPPVTAIPEVLEYRPERVGNEYRCKYYKEREESSESMRATFIKKVVLSSSSPSAPNTVAMAIGGEHDSLFYCRLGDDQWNFLAYRAKDIIFSDNRFFWVNQVNNRAVAKFISLTDLLTMYDPVGLTEWIYERPNSDFGGEDPIKVYLVTSPGGDLLYVTRYTCGFDKTIHFKVYNIFNLKYSSNQQNEEEEEEMESLGDYVLFLGYNDSCCVPSCNFPADFPGPKMNCIYFIDDHSRFDNGWLGCSDMGIFDYENKTISPFPGYKHNPDLLPPIWFMPCSQ